MGGIARPDARMKLNAGGRGKNGGFGIGIVRVQRADAGLNVGFGEAGDAQVAGIQAFGGAMRGAGVLRLRTGLLVRAARREAAR